MAAKATKAEKDNPALKNPELYAELRDQGDSAEKSARMSNAAAQKGNSAKKVASRGGESGSYDDWTVTDLKKRARELGLSGYSSEKKADLIAALRKH